MCGDPGPVGETIGLPPWNQCGNELPSFAELGVEGAVALSGDKSGFPSSLAGSVFSTSAGTPRAKAERTEAGGRPAGLPGKVKRGELGWLSRESLSKLVAPEGYIRLQNTNGRVAQASDQLLQDQASVKMQIIGPKALPGVVGTFPFKT